MQEEVTIKIPGEILNALKGEQRAGIVVLEEYFRDNLKVVQDLLFNYHYDKRERVYDLKIEEGSVVFDGNKGFFKAVYTIGFFNACADLDYNAPEKMRIDFSVDNQSGEILLKGEYWPERGQDEI